MTCRTVTLAGGGAAFFCSRGGRPKNCSTAGCNGYGVALCDYPLTGPKAPATCDRTMCARCRHEQSPGVDYCPTHHAMAKERRPAGA